MISRMSSGRAPPMFYSCLVQLEDIHEDLRKQLPKRLPAAAVERLFACVDKWIKKLIQTGEWEADGRMDVDEPEPDAEKAAADSLLALLDGGQ
eukprot:47149-Eustigmatos_ZCMA.PRE.1